MVLCNSELWSIICPNIQHATQCKLTLKGAIYHHLPVTSDPRIKETQIAAHYIDIP